MASDKTKSAREKFRRRKNNLLKKGFQLGKLCDADIAIIIHKNGHFYTYRSKDEESWPPSISQIVRKMPNQ